MFDYWRYFFRGINCKPGYRYITVSWWNLIHILIGVTLALAISTPVDEAAKVILFPLIGILIGLAFAWSGNSQALLQTEEIHVLTEHYEGGFPEYVYSYQNAILVILITLITWGIAGLSVFDKLWPTSDGFLFYLIIETILYTLLSMSVRECWRVVLDTQRMLIVQREIKKIEDEKKKKEQESSGGTAPSEQ
jgi:hypothetical protein